MYSQQENMCTDLLQIVFLQLHRNTELARAVDVMMARAKRIYILVIKLKGALSRYLATL